MGRLISDYTFIHPSVGTVWMHEHHTPFQLWNKHLSDAKIGLKSAKLWQQDRVKCFKNDHNKLAWLFQSK